jgi:hypothetical protein
MSGEVKLRGSAAMEEAPVEEQMAGVPIEPALHLRVLAAILGGQAEDARVQEALTLAQEIYELELDASLEDYRSS